MASMTCFSSPGHAASWTIEPGCVSVSTTPMAAATLPCVPGFHTGASGERRSTMHPLPFRIEEMVAHDFDRPVALAQRIGGEGAFAVARLATLHQRKPDISPKRR